MSGLFIRLYLDEDVDVLVAEMVWAHGFDALTTGRRGGSVTAMPPNSRSQRPRGGSF